MENNKMTTLVVDDTHYPTQLNTKYSKRKVYEPEDLRKSTAFIPGTIREIFVEEGQNVEKNQPVLILEAMKMRNQVNAPFKGKIKKIYVKTGEHAPKSHLLFEMM